MLNLTSDQRIRLNKHKVAFAKDLLNGTISHCKKLYKSGMPQKATEILSTQLLCSFNEAKKLLINSLIEDEFLTPIK